MEFQDDDLRCDFGIYGIFNKITDNVYIGQTSVSFQKRYWHHQWKLRNGSHDNPHLQNAWNLYGEDNFIFKPLCVVDDASTLDDLEIEYIHQYRQQDRCYNMLDGGGGRRGVPLSDEHKRKIGEINRGLMTGRKASDKTKSKMSASRIGKVNRNNPKIVMTDDLVAEVKRRLITGEKAPEIAKSLDIEYRHINNMIANNTWSSIFVDGWDEYRRHRSTYHRLSKEDHVEIFRLFSEMGYTKHQLANIYHKGVKMIERILRDQKQQSHDNPVLSLE